MSIRSVPSSTFTKAYSKSDSKSDTKIETNNRRSTTVDHSRNPEKIQTAIDSLVNNDWDNPQPDHTTQESNHTANNYKNALSNIDNLADALAQTHEANSGKTSTDEQLKQAKQGFQNQFTNSAKDAKAFQALMQTAFGNNYDQQAAENIRQQTLTGDFSWMPDIKVVDGSSLADTSGRQKTGIGLAAYNSDSDTIYLSKELLAGNPQKAVEILTEEVGHAIDTRINTFDSAGDEGELFAKLVDGEKLSDAQIQALRSENDHGTIEIDGRTIEVEYFKLKLPSLSDIGRAASGALQTVGDVLTDGAQVLGDAATHGAQAIHGIIGSGHGVIGSGIEMIADGVKDVGGTFSNSVNAIGSSISSSITRIGDNLSNGVNYIGDKFTDGLDFFNDKIVSPTLNFIPVIGPWINDHIVQPGFGLLETGVNLATNVVDSAIDFSTHTLSGVVDFSTNLLAGDFKGAWGSLVNTAQTLGQDILGFAIESVVIPTKGIAAAINAMFNLTEYRGLRPDEQAYLQTIYGNSLDYDEIRIQTGGGIEALLGLPPHAVGNDIFIPEDTFDSDGSLTINGPESGWDLLAHEAAHVWQFQNKGASYIGDAVLSYGQSHIEQGDRNGAYDFTTAIEEMKPWNEMTPDEQAEIAMVIGEALEQGNGVLTEIELEKAINIHNGGRGALDLTPDHVAYLQYIHRILQAGIID